MKGDIPPFIDPIEDCPWRSPREILADLGFVPLSPTELNDIQLPGRLWELLYAAAARRFFFHSTNHLSDRAFYMLIWEKWLDEPTADIPLEAETNTNTIVSEFDANGMTHQEIYLRYYADDMYYELSRKDDPRAVFPPHEDPPFDRDRFLPTAPIPLEAHAPMFPGEDGEIENDPLVDDEILESGIPADIPPPSEEEIAALEADLEASEPDNWTPPAQTLVEENVPLLPPAEITRETLTPILWELIHNLALRGFYISHTNHLSDQDLYSQLWHHGLREPAMLTGRNPRGGWFHDFLGSWGEEELQLWLRYYATPEERQKHGVEWPKDIIPPAQKPPYNRDWRLPKGPF